MEQYLIDTNAVCDYFTLSFPPVGAKFLDAAIDNIPNISVITQIELLCWNINSTVEQNIRDFIADCIVIEIAPEVIAQCVLLRKNKKIKTPDAIIAATAMAHNFTLVTANEKDFKNIKGLKLINPHKI